MYDFDTIYSRKNIGAAKWDLMGLGDNKDNIVPFSVADMEFRTAPEIIEAVKETGEFGLWGYGTATTEYKMSVVSWMAKRHNWSIEPEWIVNSSGVVPAIYSAVRAFTKEGDGIVIQTPVYGPFYKAIEKNKRKIIENPLKIVGGRYEMDFEDLEKKAKNAKMMILCSPHNPVGRVFSKEELEKVAEICYKNNIFVFSDEIHSDLIFSPYEHTSYGVLDKKYQENCMIGTAASKTFSLAGLGCSNLIIANESIRKKYIEEVSNSGYGFQSTFGLAATKAAYEKGEQWLGELLKYLWGNYQYLKEFMKENFKDVIVYELQGTYLVWLDFTSFAMDKDQLEEFMTKEAKLFLDEGYIFGDAGTCYERINIACPRKVLEDGLNRLKEAAINKKISSF